ncbi:MAG: ABC transporter permease [Planctomycetota bacterium]|nr:ABC transporter permease [Planctomycetota bacterium]
MNLAGIAWRELRHRRSSLVSGLVAITLGIAVVVGVRSVTVASEHAVAVKLDSLGANVLVLPQGATVDDYHTADIDAPTFPEEYVERMVTSALLGVENISPKLTRRTKIEGVSIVLTGILPDSEVASKPTWQLEGLEGAPIEHVCSGRHGVHADPRLQRTVVETLAADECLLGADAAQRLDKVAGDRVALEGQELTVARVLPATGTVDDDRMFMHLHAAQDLLGTGRQVSAIEVMGCCEQISEGLLSKLRNVLPDTRVTGIAQIVSTQIETNRLMDKISWGILLIVLLVGGLSIGNYMWGNVTQRRREIGILRMLGARRGGIIFLLLAKAVVLGVLGGLLGYGIGTLAVVLIGPGTLGLDVRALPAWIGGSLLLAVSVAVLGSLLPAWLASRFDPSANMQEI